MKVLSDRIRFLPASEDPLSADVYLIEGDERCYIYDVGNNDAAVRLLSGIEREKTVILSHHHWDHVGNIGRIRCQHLYVGRKTQEAIGMGETIEQPYTIQDGVTIEIFSCVSPHTEGSLIVSVDHEYTLIADLYFTRPPFDREKAMEMVAALKKINTKYFVISHLEDGKVVSKERLIKELTAYFKQ